MHRLERQKKLVPILRKALHFLDDCPNREGLSATAQRWAEALTTCTAGIDADPAKVLATIFTLDGDDAALTHNDGSYDQYRVYIDV
jgi:GTP cyclohydrolase I